MTVANFATAGNTAAEDCTTAETSSEILITQKMKPQKGIASEAKKQEKEEEEEEGLNWGEWDDNLRFWEKWFRRPPAGYSTDAGDKKVFSRALRKFCAERGSVFSMSLHIIPKVILTGFI